jgi:hypothetical protein
MPTSPGIHGPYRSPGYAIVCGLGARGIALAAGLAVLAAPLALTQQSPQQQNAPVVTQPAPWAGSNPAAIRMPDANAQMQMQMQQTRSAKEDAANQLRKKQIADDAAKLLELATELKQEVDKTNKDTLSLEVIRKAESIQRLAKGVKEKMKLTVGAS